MSPQKCYTSRLYSRSSLISGFSTVFNIYGNFYSYNYSKSPIEADIRALKSDWSATGGDIKNAISKFRIK